MNADLIILRVASERRDAQNEYYYFYYKVQPSTQLQLLVVSSSRPSSRCCWQYLEEGRGGTSRGDAKCAQHQLRRSNISSVAAAAAGDGSVPSPLGSPSNEQPLDGFATCLPP